MAIVGKRASFAAGTAGALLLACGSGGTAGPLGDVGTYLQDGGPFASGDAGAASADLDASIENQSDVTVQVVAVSCAGACVGVRAVATGGHPPYAFTWEDGSTSAARTLCPAVETAYRVKVSDTGTSGEFARPPETANASVTADVLGACADGGALAADAGATDAGAACVDPGDAPWTGCVTIGLPSAPSAGASAVSNWCTYPTGTSTPYSYALCLPKAMLAGQAYTVTATYQVANVIGPVPESGVSASTGACAESQTIVPVQSWPTLVTPYSGTFTQSACITAEARYPELVFEMVQETYSSIPSFEYTFQICTGCAVDP